MKTIVITPIKKFFRKAKKVLEDMGKAGIKGGDAGKNLRKFLKAEGRK